ncbi:MFS general substrate transporter [Pholiota conissans]|uniref:MFS general substrate transporter n=1 Tax=Pholiota conissans TaxID=109636 RepID=A0A9P6D0I0_9AGAR|nr:MFS general substrate transporter [Pholiota conissans]
MGLPNDYEELTVVDNPSASLLTEDDASNSRPLSQKERSVSRWQFYTLCWSLFFIGWTDGSIGPLLPRIHEVYNVGFDTLSWIFILGFSGNVSGALLNMPIGDRLGLGKMLVFSAGFQAIAATAQSLALPFPLFAISFAIAGIGVSVQDAQANGFIAIVKHDGERKMALLHASYGVGALISPLFSTQFAQAKYWSLHYAVSLLLALINATALAYAFKFKDQDENLILAGEIIPEKVNVEEGNKYSQMLRLKSVHLLALFLVTYIGVEMTIGGWIVTILVFSRGGGPNTGYVTSGYFGGMTVGRVVLIKVNKKIGEIRAIYVYTCLAILLQLVVWLVPSLIVNAIAVFLIGVLLGPMYPIAISHTARIVPRSLITGTIGWITAAGAAGSALLPFLTGTVAGKLGVGALQPLLFGMMILMGCIWGLVPKE